MSASKYSPWFPASIKPVRDGVYQVRGLLLCREATYSFLGGAWYFSPLLWTYSRISDTMNNPHLNQNLALI